MRRRSTLVLVLGVFAGAALGLFARPAGAEEQPTVLRQIERYQSETWHWQQLMKRPKTPADEAASRSSSRAFRGWVLRLWKQRAGAARDHASHPPQREAWLCIQRHEAPWRANTGNGYYGGLQMDVSFQRRYGARLLRRKGTADNWTPLEQIWVAVHAHASGRGFYPWPRTARACGVL